MGVTEDPPSGASDVGPAGSPLGESHVGSSREGRPAFYAARAGGWRDWWTLLHPPYTAWHLAYVVIGACLAPTINATRLVATLLAFFFAVGLAAHSLDELNGRPLGTRIPAGALVAVTVVGLAAAIALGLAGWVRNRRDGSVEACVQGDDDAITAVVSWARRGPPAARVSDVVVTESEEPTPENKQFEILDTR